LLNLDAFRQVVDLLMHYTLDLVMTKWLNTKIIGLVIKEGKEEAIDFKLEEEEEEATDRKLGSLGPICLLVCALLLRYSLPCKH
jgi:hypothetical protein